MNTPPIERGYYTTNRAAVGGIGVNPAAVGWIVVICGRPDKIRPREAGG